MLLLLFLLVRLGFEWFHSTLVGTMSLIFCIYKIWCRMVSLLMHERLSWRILEIARTGKSKIKTSILMISVWSKDLERDIEAGRSSCLMRGIIWKKSFLGYRRMRTACTLQVFLTKLMLPFHLEGSRKDLLETQDLGLQMDPFY